MLRSMCIKSSKLNKFRGWENEGEKKKIDFAISLRSNKNNSPNIKLIFQCLIDKKKPQKVTKICFAKTKKI